MVRRERGKGEGEEIDERENVEGEEGRGERVEDEEGRRWRVRMGDGGGGRG